MYDLIIVGGGPAGLTAAIYAIRKRLNVFLVSQDLGGKTNYRMELAEGEAHQVIRGLDIVEKFWRELDYLEFARHLEPVTKITKESDLFYVETAGGNRMETKSVILATGARVQSLGVPGEKEFFGRGLSYSAVSHAPLFLGKRTAVIGQGPLALRAVTELSLGADSVHLITPGPEMLETPLVKRLATDLKVILWEGYKIKEIVGTAFAERIIMESSDGAEAEIDIDGIFVELGLLPNSESVRGLAELDEQNRVKINTYNQTSCPGLFAAGDVTDALAEQILIAVGEGAKAALSAYDYLLPTL